jgi:hypothetical protein
MIRVIKISDGVAYIKDVSGKFTILDAPEVDAIARANGQFYAEGLVKEYNGRTLKLDKNLQITDMRVTKNEQT